MAIRITQSMMYSDMVGQMQKNLSAYMESNIQGSTQKKINRPSDDPAGTYRVLTTRDNIEATKQLQTNVKTAKGWLKLADNTLGTQVSNTITRLKSLAEQASTGTMSPENREQIGYEVREIFGQLLNLANTEFEGKSIFAGHRYDKNAFEQGMGITTWDEAMQPVVQQGQYSIEGKSAHSMMVQFTQDGEVGGNQPLTWRWSKDGGKTWNDETLPANTRELTMDGVVVRFDGNFNVRAGDPDGLAGAKEGTTFYVRPTAEYQGDDKDPPPEVTVMGGPAGLQGQAQGDFAKNVLVRFDTAADLGQLGQDFTWSYSTDGGANWVTARGQTTGNNTVRLPVPGGYIDVTGQAAGPPVPVGTQMLIHPSRADLRYEILEDTFISVNSVGKDIFGGHYKGRPAIAGEENLFELVGDFIAYCENNNQEGCQRVLAGLDKAQQRILTETARLGGLENRVEMASNVLSFQKLDQQERLSYTEDIDLTELVTKLSRQQLTYQTVLQSSSMIMKLSLANYV